MSTRLQWAMLFLLVCICAPPLVAFWVNNASTISKSASLGVLSIGFGGLICYLLWGRR